jgi:hypothetical protein
VIAALIFGVFSLTRAEEVQKAEELISTPPLKFRFNTQLVEKFFHARDQEILKAFVDVPIEVEEDSKLQDMTITLSPTSGEVKDFDLDLSIALDNFGASSNNIAFSGKASLEGNEFNFSGPIANVNMKYALGEKYNHDHKYMAKVFKQ